ncbi:MAG: DUF6448 family protein [Candidatus Heimdallarchaeota archaeon]
MIFIPPHCDTMDGPVVKAAELALNLKDVKLILPWVPKDSEKELTEAFKKTLIVREKGKEEKEVSDYWFFETAVRLHRKGEGKGFTGLKPAGLDWGPVVPNADQAIESGNPKQVIDLILKTAEKELTNRFEYAISKKNYEKHNVDEAREYVHSMLEFVLYSHHLYKFIISKEHHED